MQISLEFVALGSGIHNYKKILLDFKPKIAAIPVKIPD